MCALVLFIGLLVFFRRTDRLTAALVLLCCLTALFLNAKVNRDYNAAMALCGRGRTVEGVIVDPPRNYYGSESCTVKITSVDGEPARAKMYLTGSGLSGAGAYDIIRLDGAYIRPAGSGTKRSVLAALGRGICLTCSVPGDGVDISENPDRPFRAFFADLRGKLTARIDSVYPDDTAPVLKAMLLGDASDVDTGTYSDFRLSGFSHIFAVSGLHLSLWVTAADAILPDKRRFSPYSNIFSCLFVLFFCALTGFSPSVTRAGVMVVLSRSGRMIFRRADPLNSLGLALTVMLLISPNAATSRSLILSAAATAGILILYPYLARLYSDRFLPERTKELSRAKRRKLAAAGRLWTLVFSPVCLSVSAMAFIMPASACLFGWTSFLSPLTTVIAMFPATAGLIAGALGAAGSPGGLLASAATALLRFVMLVCRQLALLPGSVVGLGYARFIIWAAVTAAAVALCFILKKRPKRLLELVSGVAAVSLAALFVFTAYQSKTAVRVARVGSDEYSCYAVLTPEKTVLIGTGGDYHLKTRLEELLYSRSRRTVDVIIIPRLKETEDGKTEAIAASFGAERVIYCLEPGSAEIGGAEFFWTGETGGGAVSLVAPGGSVLFCCRPSATAGELSKLPGVPAAYVFSRDKLPVGADRLVRPGSLLQPD